MSAPLCLLGVSGSVAAYKSVLLTRLLLRRGFAVQVLMTEAATRFVGEETFSALTGRRVLRSLFGEPGEAHVALAREARIMVVAPCTAATLARLAQGLAQDALSATALCFRGPLVVAPAMHPSMWTAKATQRNAAQLAADGVHLIGPEAGEVASGEHGVGRLTEPETLATLIASLADEGRVEGPLAGRQVVVTAGPTVEDLDPVRFLSNRSSGKMGFAIAGAAAHLGAEVTLLAGPVALPTPPGVTRTDFRSALELRAALAALTPGADAVIMAAAVGDYRAASISERKLKRSGPTHLELVPNPDLIAELGAQRTGPRPVLVAFAVETGTDSEVAAYAQKKLAAKRVDLVVANHAEDALGKDENRVQLITTSGITPISRRPKTDVAQAIMSWLVQQLAEQNGHPTLVPS